MLQKLSKYGYLHLHEGTDLGKFSRLSHSTIITQMRNKQADIKSHTLTVIGRWRKLIAGLKQLE